MNDTVRIQRPLNCRRQEDLGGRVKRNSQGNTTRVVTRVNDAQNDLIHQWREPNAVTRKFLIR